MIPLVILDLDGTIIGREGRVSTRVWEAAERARELGIKLAVCTGRPGMGVALQVARRLGPANPHVFQAGAHIAYPDGETLKASSLKESVAQEIVQHARDEGLMLEVYTPQFLYVERKTALSEAHAKAIGVTAMVSDLATVVANEAVIRAQWVIPAEQEAAAMALNLQGVTVTRATSPTVPDTLFISLTRAGVSKGSAVRDLVEHLKVPLEQVMAVGDSEGDLPMLEQVGFPVVMGNADEELRQRFERVVPGVEEDGVVEALALAASLKGR